MFYFCSTSSIQYCSYKQPTRIKLNSKYLAYAKIFEVIETHAVVVGLLNADL